MRNHKKLKLLISLIIILVLSRCINGENKMGLTQKMYFDLCGTWGDSRNMYVIDSEYSWGTGKSQPNATVEIDFGVDKPYLLESGMGLHEIKQITSKGSRYKIIMTYTPSQIKKIVYLEIEVIDENTIRFVQVKDDKNFYEMDSIGQPYYKYSGPKKIYYMPKSSNLEMKKKNHLGSEVIRKFNDNEKIVIIALGEKIKNTRWIKVLTENSEIGWCLKNELVELKSIK